MEPETVSRVQIEPATLPPKTKNTLKSATLGKSMLWTGLEPADWRKAQESTKAESNKYYKGVELDDSNVDLNYFKVYGTGIFLFFSFVKQMSLLFLFFSTILIVPITINLISGNAYKNGSQSLQNIITRTSIGNYLYVHENEDSYSSSLSFKIANVSIDIFCVVCFVIFYFYWDWKSQKAVKQINQEIKLQSSYTVQVVKFPSDATESDIQNFMSQFGEVCEVAAVKFHSEQIMLSKQIFQVQMEIKQFQMIDEFMKNNQNQQKIQDLKAYQVALHDKLVEYQDFQGETLKFYVQFQQPQARDAIVKAFRPYQSILSCLRDTRPASHYLKNQQVWVVPCESEPTGIIWQNNHVNFRRRFPRALLQVLIVLLVIVIGFILIAIMNAILPGSSNDLDTSSYTFEQIQNQTSSNLIQSWCVNHFSPWNTQYSGFCHSSWITYVKSTCLRISISLLILIFRFLVKTIMIKISKFQRYTTHTEQSVTIMSNLLVTYSTTTVLMTILLQTNIFSISFKNFIKFFIFDSTLIKNLQKLTQYTDLTSSWYKDVGYQVWFNVFLMTVIPHLYMPLLYYIQQKYRQGKASNQLLHKKMYELLRPMQFQIQDNYADVLLIVGTGFIFGGASPAIIIASCVALIGRYFYFKYIFIRFCRVPRTYNESLNERAMSIIKFIIIFRCIISIFSYGASGIFANQKSVFQQWADSLALPFFSFVLSVLSRMLTTWYYSMFTVFLMLLFVFKDVIVDNLVKFIKGDQQQNKDNTASEDTQSQFNKMSVKSQRILTKSYKLENNPDYQQILAIMNMKKRQGMAVIRQTMNF